MIEILNNQRKIYINPLDFQGFIESAIESFLQSKNKFLTVAFVSDEQIKKLNNEFRQKNYATDVLSFPSETDEFDADENYLGDIVISAEQAEKQALENGLTLELEIKQLILHGILHLCGFDHATDNGEMNALELELRDKLGVG